VNLEVAGGGRATDDDLQLLRSLPIVQDLTLAYNDALSNECLKHVGKLKDLRGLYIAGCPRITDAGLSHLRDLSQLTSLQLVRCNMDGSGLVHVQKLPITYLILNYTQVTDENLAFVSSMSDLANLCMQDSAVTSRGLVHLRGLTKLWELDLNRTAVDDEGLVHLTGLTKLKHLLLSDTKVTDEGVAKLKEALPNLKQIDQ
jgi:hypothetical protein